MISDKIDIDCEVFSDSTEKQFLKLKKSNSHFVQMIMENPFITTRRHKSMKKPKSANVLSSAFIPFDTCSTKECPQIETEQKMLNTKSDRSTRKSIVKSSIQEQKKNKKDLPKFGKKPNFMYRV